ncbi:MAG TPA: YbdD/YjiX family protein [Steroidobacteraceae bacterium]|nr:YbdD/YjiX family protein [Steroidobacteraceae bacterium]
MKALVRQLWQALRALTGDDAYERYLEHWRRAHAGERPLDAAQFHRQEEERRWSGGPNRCC